MTRTIFLILIFIPLFIFAQKTKKVRDKDNDAIYFVLKSDKATKHGAYTLISHNNAVLAKGYYKYGVQDSIWEYYDFEGKLVQKYDFTKKELIYYFLSEEEKNKKYKVVNGAESKETTLGRPPLYIGGTSNLYFNLWKNITYPRSARESGIMGTVNVKFTIDKNGKTSNFHIDKPLGYGLDEESIRVVKLISDKWLPGLLNGKAIDVEYTFPVKYTLVR